jgi:hypothetical protein
LTTETPLNSLFDDNHIRRIFYEDKWHYSVIDIIIVIFDLSIKDAQNYSYYLKKRLRKEMGDTSFNYKKTRLTSRDGKQYLTEVVDAEQALRLIQSFASPKVEPIKQWLSQIGAESFDKTINSN